MEHLIKALPTIVRAGANAPEVVEAAAIAAWKYLAGEPLRKQAVATNLSGQTLVVAVSDLIWQRQLESMRAPLLLRLNAILGQQLIRRIEFRIDVKSVGPLSETVVGRSKGMEPKESNLSLELLSAANAIQDQRLRKAFLSAAASRLRQTEHNLLASSGSIHE